MSFQLFVFGVGYFFPALKMTGNCVSFSHLSGLRFHVKNSFVLQNMKQSEKQSLSY